MYMFMYIFLYQMKRIRKRSRGPIRRLTLRCVIEKEGTVMTGPLRNSIFTKSV